MRAMRLLLLSTRPPIQKPCWRFTRECTPRSSLLLPLQNCANDARADSPPKRHFAPLQLLLQMRQRIYNCAPVSYTHLTLPTICSV